MAYTVKQVAALSGVSVRTLHFYNEIGLLKPAYIGANDYRYYEEPQLLTLQQILFYRELGFELKKVRQMLGRASFERKAALQSHRSVLLQKVAQMHTLIATIDKTVEHLKGKKKMKTEEMFAGFSVGAGVDRFGDKPTLGGEPNDCKVSGRDTGGALCVFEFHGLAGGPRHVHREQDEWIYVLEGELDFELGTKRLRVGTGESVFVPRRTSHAWVSTTERPAKILNAYEPAGKIEAFFRRVGEFKQPPIHEALSLDQMHHLFEEHGLDLVGPPLRWPADGTHQGRPTSSHPG